ncbi:hypothetical protein BP6252_09122 [Coleophoma cylindrospora]|uniref:Uncharacterized protein n=1 Tax=Coleophoma cylindrospora TaxID=1849047 RepID=A0A3D8R127_9HELO|nr:hypothetical protein BP6252_09122 [Coleophoma cylindrospora]
MEIKRATLPGVAAAATAPASPDTVSVHTGRRSGVFQPTEAAIYIALATALGIVQAIPMQTQGNVLGQRYQCPKPSCHQEGPERCLMIGKRLGKIGSGRQCIGDADCCRLLATAAFAL